MEGLLGITLDNSTIVLININEVVNKGEDSDCHLTKRIKNEACPVEEDDDIDLEMSVENSTLQDYHSSPENSSEIHPRLRTKRNIANNDSGKNQAKRKKQKVDIHVGQTDLMRDLEDETDLKTKGRIGIHTFDCMNRT